MPLDFFSKTSLPNLLPEEMEKVVNQLKQSLNKEDCLRKTYDILIKKYHGCHFKTYLKLYEVFSSDIYKLWKKKGFMHCTNINYVMRILLIASGFFKEEDIRLKWTLIWYVSPHQYLQIKINGKWLNIDVWAYAHGIKFGDNAHGFH